MYFLLFFKCNIGVVFECTETIENDLRYYGIHVLNKLNVISVCNIG